MAYERRTKAFHRRDALQKHFRAHLSHIPDGQEIDCPHPGCTEKAVAHAAYTESRRDGPQDSNIEDCSGRGGALKHHAFNR